MLKLVYVKILNTNIPNASKAASRYLQSGCLILSLTNGKTYVNISFPQHETNNNKQTLAALLGFHSSSSSNSS